MPYCRFDNSLLALGFAVEIKLKRIETSQERLSFDGNDGDIFIRIQSDAERINQANLSSAFIQISITSNGGMVHISNTFML